MSGAGKRSFTSFVRPAAAVQIPQEPTPIDIPLSQLAPSDTGRREAEHIAGQGGIPEERTRVVTSTGRVRTYTASRNLPGVTLRMSESRWERLKLLSIQERRPIQEILGEAMADFMRSRGLPW